MLAIRCSLHPIPVVRAIASLDAFEFNLLAHNSLFNHPAKVTAMTQAPPRVRAALLLASFASPLADRVFHTAAWVESLQSMVDELQVGKPHPSMTNRV